jgi:hypothetical protein
MFDCLEIPTQPTRRASAAPALPSLQSAQRRHPGRNWVHIAPRRGLSASLSRARDVARQLAADIEPLADGGLLVVGLGLNDTLLFCRQLGDELVVEARIALQGAHD